MQRELTREALRAIVEDLDFPETRLGSLTLDNEAAWLHALGRATPGERIRLLVSIEPELMTATKGGKERLLDSEDRHDAGFVGGEIDSSPAFYGDEPALADVRAALALVPAVVRYAVLREVAFLAVGRGTFAWTSSARFVDIAGRRKDRVIVIGPTCDVQGIVHEIAHVWSDGPVREESQAITAEGEAGFRQLAEIQGWLPQIDRYVGRGERLADALALAWLYADVTGRPA